MSIQDLNRMKSEFKDVYEEVFQDAEKCLKKTWIAKLKAMKECRALIKVNHDRRYHNCKKHQGNSSTKSEMGDMQKIDKIRYQVREFNLGELDENNSMDSLDYSFNSSNSEGESNSDSFSIDNDTVSPPLPNAVGNKKDGKINTMDSSMKNTAILRRKQLKNDKQVIDIGKQIIQQTGNPFKPATKQEESPYLKSQSQSIYEMQKTIQNSDSHRTQDNG